MITTTERRVVLRTRALRTREKEREKKCAIIFTFGSACFGDHDRREIVPLYILITVTITRTTQAEISGSYRDLLRPAVTPIFTANFTHTLFHKRPDCFSVLADNPPLPPSLFRSLTTDDDDDDDNERRRRRCLPSRSLVFLPSREIRRDIRPRPRALLARSLVFLPRFPSSFLLAKFEEIFTRDALSE